MAMAIVGDADVVSGCRALYLSVLMAMCTDIGLVAFETFAVRGDEAVGGWNGGNDDGSDDG